MRTIKDIRDRVAQDLANSQSMLNKVPTVSDMIRKQSQKDVINQAWNNWELFTK